MESTVTALAIASALSLWHLRNRRHPGWRASPDGRFAVFCGYSLVAIAVYWLEMAPTATTWEWAWGNLWGLAAMASSVWGFDALNRATAEHAERSQAFETFNHSEGALPPRI